MRERKTKLYSMSHKITKIHFIKHKEIDKNVVFLLGQMNCKHLIFIEL